ncbi:hypothetical protein NDU88_003266 [Pleurodeles waltl]|uniref:Uncharacterized protein n=1 Tax=Pleurodeles waltl TaxID=8319 RepID=A0AAV7MDD4_PLEWA|nr:hypothetical protein NDU88_003266 [Pleurodeles waltl]
MQPSDSGCMVTTQDEGAELKCARPNCCAASHVPGIKGQAHSTLAAAQQAQGSPGSTRVGRPAQPPAGSWQAQPEPAVGRIVGEAPPRMSTAWAQCLAGSPRSKRLACPQPGPSAAGRITGRLGGQQHLQENSWIRWLPSSQPGLGGPQRPYSQAHNRPYCGGVSESCVRPQWPVLHAVAETTHPARLLQTF